MLTLRADETEIAGMHTFDTIPLLHSGQELQLLQHVDSVVQHVQYKWNEDGKADSPGSTSFVAWVWSLTMAAVRQQGIRVEVWCTMRCEVLWSVPCDRR